MKKKSDTWVTLKWIAIFICLILITLYTITSMNKDFSVRGFIEYTKNASPLWLWAAVACMLAFVLFEALSLRYICKGLGYSCSVRKGMLYSAADICFSAITPSATGGQPASAYCMMNDGIPTAVTTIALLVNLTMYTVSLLVIGIVCLAIKPGIFLSFTLFSRVLILFGFLVHLALLFAFLCLIFKENLLVKFTSWCLSLLHKLHIIKDIAAKRQKLQKVLIQYKYCADVLRNNGAMLLRVLGYNLGQRISIILVTLCVFMAVKGSPSLAAEICVTQGLVILGSNSVPIPGAVGMADFLFLDGFKHITEDTISIELLSRGISFYGCLLVCAVIVVVGIFFRKHMRIKNAKSLINE